MDAPTSFIAGLLLQGVIVDVFHEARRVQGMFWRGGGGIFSVRYSPSVYSKRSHLILSVQEVVVVLCIFTRNVDKLSKGAE